MLMLTVALIFFFLVLMGMPLYFSFGVSASLACIFGGMPLEIIAQRLMIGMDSFALLAIPGFVLVGEIMCQGGISKRAVDFSNALIGHFTGGPVHGGRSDRHDHGRHFRFGRGRYRGRGIGPGAQHGRRKNTRGTFPRPWWERPVLWAISSPRPFP